MHLPQCEIHPQAIVSPEAKLGAGVKVGPFCIVGPHVVLGENTFLHGHVVMEGHLRVGKNNQFFPFNSIGTPPQDVSYKGEPTEVEIGDHNIFREYVSIHRGTLKQQGITKVGNNNLLMAYVHLGHDVTVGNNTVLVNAVNIAGHVTVGDRCIISGDTSVAQFITIGRGAYIAGASAIDRDIPPFCIAIGNRVRMKGVNIVGLRRQGVDKKSVSEIVEFYRTMENSSLSPRAFVEHAENLQDYLENPWVMELAQFIRKSEVGMAPFMN